MGAGNPEPGPSWKADDIETGSGRGGYGGEVEVEEEEEEEGGLGEADKWTVKRGEG